jgi:transmembrane sensor
MSTKHSLPKLNRQILDEASAWFVEFRVGDVDARARRRFDQWLKQSPEHIRAYMEIAKTYVALPALNPERKIDVQELIAHALSEGNVVPFEHAARPNQPLSPAAEPNRSLPANGRAATAIARLRRARLGRRSLAASIATACVTAGLLSWVAVHRYPTYATDIGERRSITLADGSTIDLNARSKVRVKFSKTERDVELIDGQALFEVAKDKARPFIVRSDAAVVRAVGTQFDVYRNRSGTTVTVIEGRVAVLSPLGQEAGGVAGRGIAPRDAGNIARITPHESAGRGQESPVIFVSAGEQVTVAGKKVAEPKRADIAATTAWMQHRLIFDGSRLSDVVEEFNRYNTRQLVIADRELDDFHISGVYSSTDPASLIRFLREQPGIEVFETDEGLRIARK